MAAGLAGSVASALYNRATGARTYTATPTWSGGSAVTSAAAVGNNPAAVGTKNGRVPIATRGGSSSSSASGRKLVGGGPVGRLGSRSGGDIVAEQVDAGVKGLAAVLGLGGFLPLLGPAGEQLVLDPYGRLLAMPDRKPLTGEVCLLCVDVCVCVVRVAIFAFFLAAYQPYLWRAVPTPHHSLHDGRMQSLCDTRTQLLMLSLSLFSPAQTPTGPGGVPLQLSLDGKCFVGPTGMPVRTDNGTRLR